MNNLSTQSDPTIFTAFGATGDLFKRKVLPALFQLYDSNQLPSKFKVIGFSRRDWNNHDFREYLVSEFPNLADRKDFDDFLNLFVFQPGNFDDKESFQNLKEKIEDISNSWKICTNKLFHLAIPPKYYENLLHQLESHELTKDCSYEIGWTRVLIEKPFGKDLKSAEKLDMLLKKLFSEEQIYRIDHYLAKEMLQNIIAFRFANNLLEDSWDSNGVEKIEIKLLESIDVQERGELYDGLGALRDVGQNHLLQMLALVTMLKPASVDASSVRPNRVDILNKLKPLTENEIKTKTVRAQYSGFTEQDGVDSKSQTETYFSIEAELDHDHWKGVPIFIESGKAMAKDQKEIIITFKHTSPCLCPDNMHVQNQVRFILEPENAIEISFWGKKPGPGYQLEEQQLKLSTEENSSSLNGYARLLLDSISGDQMLFVSTEEVQAMWRFVDPILENWSNNKTELRHYEKGTLLNNTHD